MRIYKLLLLFAVLIDFSGCGLFSSKKIAAPAASASENQVLASSEENASIPFQIKIFKETNDGAQLRINGELVRKAPFPLEGVVLKLTGFNQGQEVGQSFYSFQSKEEDQVSEAGSIPFEIVLNQSVLSDYQLELLWGSEAKSYLTLNAPMQKTNQVDVKNVLLEACDAPNCKQSFTVRAELQNLGAQTIAKVVLGISFVRTDAPSSEAANQNEITLNLDNLGLRAGLSRSLRLAVENKIARDKIGLLKPVIRVLSYE